MGASVTVIVVVAAAVLLAVGVGILLWRRADQKRWVAASDLRASQVPERRSSLPPPPGGGARPSSVPREAGPKLPPHRIVFATDEVPVLEVVRARRGAGPPNAPLEAPSLTARLAPVAREAARLMALPGSDCCRISIHTEVARAMQAGILPLVLSKHPIALPKGEGIEVLRSDATQLAELGAVAWQAACAEPLQRFLDALEGRISLLGGGSSMHEAIATTRARRNDLLELVRDVVAGTIVRDRAKERLRQVEDSCRARTDDGFRQLATLPPAADDAGLALRQVGGYLLVTAALRVAAVEVRALAVDAPDLALPKLKELEALVARIAAALTSRRRPEVDDAVTDLLAFVQDLETTIRAAREGLFAAELTLLADVNDDGVLRGIARE